MVAWCILKPKIQPFLEFALIFDQQISKQDVKQLSTSTVTCDNTKQDDRQVTISGVTCDNTKQDDRKLPNSGVTCDNTNQDDRQLSTSAVTSDKTNQDDRQLPISGVTCDNIKTEKLSSAPTETAEPFTEKIGEPSAIVTTRDARSRSQKRISLKRTRERWTGLRKRRVSFVIRKRANKRSGVRSWLTSKRPGTKATNTSSEGNLIFFTADLIRTFP